MLISIIPLVRQPVVHGMFVLLSVSKCDIYHKAGDGVSDVYAALLPGTVSGSEFLQGKRIPIA